MHLRCAAFGFACPDEDGLSLLALHRTTLHPRAPVCLQRQTRVQSQLSWNLKSGERLFVRSAMRYLASGGGEFLRQFGESGRQAVFVLLSPSDEP